MTSHRYAPAIGVCLALALVPTLIHSYSGRRITDGLSTAAIPTTLAGYVGAASDREATWGQRHFDSFDWMERDYVHADDLVRLTVVRSYDIKSLYHHPELAIAYHDGASWGAHTVRRLPGRPEVPLHVLTSTGDHSAIALYVLHYDGRFIEDPIWFQLQTAGELLFSRRKAMTVLFAFDARVPEGASVDTLGATRVLSSALAQFAPPAPAAH